MDKNAAYPKAMDELKEQEKLSEAVELRQNKYLNNIVEQDHRGIKRLVKPGVGFGVVLQKLVENRKIPGKGMG